MRRALAVLLCATLSLTLDRLAVAQDTPPPATPEEPQAPEGKRQRGGEDAGRQLDTESPVARALDELLIIDPRYATDGTVRLEYDFTDETQLADWTLQGLDRAEESGPRGGRGRRVRNGNPTALSLGCGSSGQGLFVHRLEMKGDYEATFRCSTVRTSTRSELVFMLGKSGAAWGTQLVQRGSSGFTALGRGEPNKDAWTGGRVVTVTVVSRGGEVTTSINGARVGASDRLGDKADGRVGIYLTDMLLVVHGVTIRGAVDPAKL
jgi:hypothetical protein